MYRQFGLHPDKASDKVTVQAFRRKVLRELKKIKLAWPGLNYATAPGVLILHPSTPKIAPLNQVQLGRSPAYSRYRPCLSKRHYPSRTVLSRSAPVYVAEFAFGPSSEPVGRLPNPARISETGETTTSCVLLRGDGSSDNRSMNGYPHIWGLAEATG